MISSLFFFPFFFFFFFLFLTRQEAANASGDVALHEGKKAVCIHEA